MVPGVAAGLAWTPMGGEILYVEASKMEGEGKLTLTGQLGDVMKESATVALNWLRSHAREVNTVSFARAPLYRIAIQTTAMNFFAFSACELNYS